MENSDVFLSTSSYIFIFILFAISIFGGMKYKKIKKLKSGQSFCRKIIGIVSEIKYVTPGKNNAGNIKDWYFIAKGVNPITNKEMDFESDFFPYKESGFKIRIFGPNEEDEKKFFEYARRFIKEGDSIKIYVSEEDSDIYYMEDLVSKSGDILGNSNFIGNYAQNLKFGFNFFLKFKIFKILFILFSFRVFFLFVFVRWLNIGELRLNLSKLDGYLKESYWVWLIICLMLIFIGYKVFKGYKSGKSDKTK